ncbi:tetratricopeptide repeat protein [Undibacterium sp. YM2]|uniref:tetratricopeptide repeat protein n=1 Tax=Undibacterium sp. YM2 TaxID=2058625 RepID=UPI00138A69E9|nr:tetratricopeptide repeat protein [Undibacterium sp. YM2]
MAKLHPISGTDIETRIADVIFVHGLGGDAFKTWRHGEDQSTSWPHWVGDEFKNVGVWSLEYAASPSRWLRIPKIFSNVRSDAGHSMALPTRSRQVLNLLCQRCIGLRPIIFVCHSLGGLLVKQILRDSSDSVQAIDNKIISATKGVLFLATPHAGATLASLLSHFSTVLGTTVSIGELKEHDAHLGNLYNWYRNHAPKHEMETFTYFETRDIKGMRIVNSTSAHPGVGTDPVATDDDHVSIAKPSDRSAAVCETLREFLSGLGAPAIINESKDSNTYISFDLGKTALSECRFEPARAHFTEALRQYKRISDIPHEAEVLDCLGIVEHAVGRFEPARAHFTEALRLYKQIGNDLGEATAVLGLGSVEHAVGRFEPARLHFTEALRLYKQIGDTQGEARAINSLGLVEHVVGRFERARAHFTEALQLYKQIGDILGEANSHSGLGRVESSLGRFEPARAHLAEVLRLYKQIGNLLGEANALDGLGNIEDALGRYDQARTAYNEALRLHKQIGNILGEANALSGLGEVERSLDRYEQAWKYFTEALLLHKQISNVLGEANVLNDIGHVESALGRNESARKYHTEALRLHKQIGNALGKPMHFRGWEG